MISALLTYVREFYGRKLTKFSDCRRYYDFMPVADLEPEAIWLLGDSIKRLPISLIFPRCYALFYEMLERCACAHYLNDAQRIKLINAAIGMKEEILRRSPASTREQVTQLILKDCEKVKRMGHFKKASDLIRDSQRDYKGSFRAAHKPARKVVIHSGNNRMH